MYKINRDGSDDEEYKDIVMLRIDLDEFLTSGDAPLVAQDLESGVLPAENLTSGDELRVVGYPGESNEIDYDSATIRRNRMVLRAEYVNPMPWNHCHMISTDTTYSPDEYDGLSGSPVFYMRRQYRGNELFLFPMLVGLLVRGTESSKTLYLISSNVLIDIVRAAELNGKF